MNADVVYDYDAGLQGFNLFVYCGNNPQNRIDISGADSEGIADGEDMLDELLLEGGGRAGGGGLGSSGGNFWGSFKNTLRSAAKGLNMASGNRDFSHSENHHMFSDKNKTYTPQYQEIMDRYDMSLNSKENIVALSGHRGRHTNQYHKFMLFGLKELDTIAAGDTELFMTGMQHLADFLIENPWLPYAR